MGLNALGCQSHLLQRCHPLNTIPVVTNDLPFPGGARLTAFYRRCKFSTLTTRQPMVEFLLTRVFTLSVAEEKTKIVVFTRIELTISALGGVRGYLLVDYSGDETIAVKV